MNPDDLFKKMMHEAKVARGVEHPENDVPDDIKFPSKDEADQLEARMRQELGLDDDIDISIMSFDMGDPEQAAEAERLFREYHEEREGDLMERPGNEDAVDDLIDVVLSNDWTAAPEPIVGESFEEYLDRIGLGDLISSDDEDPDDDIEDGPFDTPEIGGEGGASFIDQLMYDQMHRTGSVGREKTGSDNRSDILSSAEVLVNGDRNAQYGDPVQDFQRTADLWTTYLNGVVDRQGGYVNLEPHDVAVMQMLLKVSRLVWSPNKKDHWVDIAGYAACGADCTETEFGGWV